MTLYEMKTRHRELLRIAETDVMTSGEFDEMMALFAKIKRETK